MLEEASSFGIGVYNAWTVRASASRGFAGDSLPRQIPGTYHLPHHQRPPAGSKSEGAAGPRLPLVSVDGIKSYRELRGIDLQDIPGGHQGGKGCRPRGPHELRDLSQEYGRAGGSGPSGGVSRRHDPFEPLHESFGIDEKVWETLESGISHDTKKAIERLIDLKREGAPIINSQTYLGMIKTLNSQIQVPRQRYRFACSIGRNYTKTAGFTRSRWEASRRASPVSGKPPARDEGDGSEMPGLPVLRLCGK